MSSKERHLLKVLTGPHIGAEMQLCHGEYKLGSNADCSIVLQDTLLNSEHISLNIEEGGVELKKISDSEVFINGIKLDVDQAKLNPLDVVEAGTTYFSIGEKNTNWNNIKIIPHEMYRELSKLELFAKIISESIQSISIKIQGVLETTKNKISNVTSVYRQVSGRSELDNRHLLSSNNGSDIDEIDTNNQATDVDEVSEKISKKYTRNNYMGLVIASAAALLFIGQLIYIILPDENDADKISEYLTKNQFTDLVIVDEKILSISGYIPSIADKHQLNGFLKSEKIDSVNNIYVDEEIISKVETIKSIFNLSHLKLKYLSKGDMNAKGFVGTDKAWETFKKSLQADIPGVKSVFAEEIYSLEDRKINLQKIIDDQGMQGNLVVSANKKGELSIRGILPETKIPKWQYAITEFRNTYGEYPAITSYVQDPKSLFSLKIRELQIGEVNYLVTEDGTRYFEGAYVDGGFLIRKIESDQIILEKNGIIANYPLGV